MEVHDDWFTDSVSYEMKTTKEQLWGTPFLMTILIISLSIPVLAAAIAIKMRILKSSIDMASVNNLTISNLFFFIHVPIN